MNLQTATRSGDADVMC